MFDQHCDSCNLILILDQKDVEEYETVFHTTGVRDGYDLYFRN